MENKLSAVMIFAAGVTVGLNWPKIKKAAGPYWKQLEKSGTSGYAALLRFLVERKEHFEDMMAEMTIKKKRKARQLPGKRGKATPPRAAGLTQPAQ